MKILNRGRSITLGLALIAAGLAAPPAVGSAAAAPTTAKPDASVVQQIRDTADGKVAVSMNRATGKVGFIRARGKNTDLLPDVVAGDRGEALGKADAYLKRFSNAFGVPRGQLERSEVHSDRYGWSVTYTQSYNGVPVFASELKAHVDKSGDLTAVNGFVAPDASKVATTPRVTEEQAAERALTMVKERPSGYEDGLPEGLTKGLEVVKNDLMIYRMGTTRGIPGKSKLAWVVEVSNKKTVRETVILDALTGKHLNRWSMMAHALDRMLIEAYDGAQEPDVVWSEGDPFPGTLDEDQSNEVLGTGEAYWLFMNTFGRDSYDGEGATMITVNNDPGIACPNANWNGFSTNYCDGVTGDDTVAHEWGHAYTEYTSGLIYQWQSGAMNEAYSDIWGEVVDMLNKRDNQVGETEADPVYRTPGQCSDFTRSPIQMEITAPEDVAGECAAAPAAFGPVIGQTPINGTAVVGTDGIDEEAGDESTTNGCLPFENDEEIDGSWVYVDRGACTFAVKAQNAEDAGAVGIVVGNNDASAPFSMAGEADIYGVMVSQADGTKFKTAGEPVDFTVSAVPEDTDVSHRWLSGESDPAFGGAIRDMWSPNCYGDPGQVSDEFYHCEASDSGGVHTNSGVVNRTFAILVDGYDPAGVDGIGLDKAANIFWHTQVNYLTPSSGFPELADALETSCADLTGQDINKMTLGDPDPEGDGSDGAATPELADPITAADCTELADAIAETELRVEPVQCHFQPLLEKGQVSCGDDTVSVTTWSEDFENGLDEWDTDVEFFSLGDYEGHVSHPWEITTDLPETTPGIPGGGHPQSAVAFSADPTTGSCLGDEDDESSRDGLISPAIEVPEGKSPRFSFDHLVATEAGWDGGNVKYSVDGGATFEEVPASAWIFNGPQATINTLGQGNTNPLAGEDGFTGTDGGEVTGSWGTSVVNLAKLGLLPGDEVHFRFDMGRDGCNGVDGWYIDNVAVTVCEDAPEAPAATTTKVTKVKPKKVKKGKNFTVRVKVSSADDTPTGTVQVKKGKKTLATAELNDNGVAVVTVKASFKVGKHQLVARYTGNDSFKASQSKFQIQVKKKK